MNDTGSAGWTLADLLPAYDKRTRHSRHVNATADEVWTALTSLSTSDLLVLSPLLTLRHRRRPAADGSLLRGAAPVPLLTTTPGRELLFGTIAKFWRPRAPRSHAATAGPEAFAAFSEPGWAKAVMSLRVDAAGEGAVLSTETRVHGTSAQARRAFLLYWPIISLWSRLIRMDIVRAVAATAERGRA